MNNMGLFVDVSNLYYCIGKKFEGRKLDYAKLRNVAGEYGVVQRAYAYGTQIADEAMSFISCLRKLGYETKYKKPRIQEATPDGKQLRKADWDVGLSMDVVRLAPRVGTIVICSSEVELLPLVQWAKDEGIRCVIIACGISRELKDVADEYFEIGEDLLEVSKA